jgi:tetratricopeptide (TPR) repeat protein
MIQPPAPQQAKVHSALAYAAAPTNRLVADTHGWILVLCGGDDQAKGVELLERLVRDHPDFADAHQHLGLAYLKLRQPRAEEAQRLLDRAAELRMQEKQPGQTP